MTEVGGAAVFAAIGPEPLGDAFTLREFRRRLRRRKGRRNLANFENIPVTTHVQELNAEERACPCCGTQRQEIGADESWQIEYYPARFERIHHLCKKYACPGCDSNGSGAQIETAAKPEAAPRNGIDAPTMES